jgi:hypothetical protein
MAAQDIQQKSSTSTESETKKSNSFERSIYPDEFLYFSHLAYSRFDILMAKKKVSFVGAMILKRILTKQKPRQDKKVDLKMARWDSRQTIADVFEVKVRKIEYEEERLRNKGLLLSSGENANKRQYAFTPEVIAFLTGQLPEPVINNPTLSKEKKSKIPTKISEWQNDLATKISGGSPTKISGRIGSKGGSKTILGSVFSQKLSVNYSDQELKALALMVINSQVTKEDAMRKIHENQSTQLSELIEELRERRGAPSKEHEALLKEAKRQELAKMEKELRTDDKAVTKASYMVLRQLKAAWRGKQNRFEYDYRDKEQQNVVDSALSELVCKYGEKEAFWWIKKTKEKDSKVSLIDAVIIYLPKFYKYMENKN